MLGAAHRAGDRVGAGVGHDQHGAAFLGRLGHRQRHAGVHGADDHVDVVALDQLVDVVGGLGRVGLVVDLEVLDLAAAELAALLLHVELEAVLDRVAERGVGAAVRQHQADLDRPAGCACAANVVVAASRAAAAERAVRVGRMEAPGGQEGKVSRMKRPASRARSAGWSRCGECPQSGITSSGFSAIDARWRGSAPACRTRRPRPAPRAPGRRSSRSRARRSSARNSGAEPDVVPAAEGRVGVGVVARQPRPQVRRLEGVAGELDALRPRCPRRRGAARRRPRRPPDDAPHGAGRSCRRRCGRTATAGRCRPRRRGPAAPRSPAACMKSTSQRSSRGLRRRAAVAVAREHKPAQACAAAELAREVLPHRDRAQALVQEHDRRRVGARRADPFVLEVQLAPAPGQARQLAPRAGSARSRG